MTGRNRSSDGPTPYGPPPEPGQEPATGAGGEPAPAGVTGPVGPPPPPSHGAPQPIAPWAPPPAPGVGEPGLQFGQTLDRVMAFILDSIIIGIPTAVVTALIVIGASGAGTGLLGRMSGSGAVAGVITAGVNLLYFVAFWTGAARATPGMRLMKLQMGDAKTGAVPTVQQGMVRWLALGGVFMLLEILPAMSALAGLAGFLWQVLLLASTATSPTRQGLHDRIADTALVQPAGAQTPARTCLLILIALFAIWVVGIAVLVMIGAQVSGILSDIGTSI